MSLFDNHGCTGRDSWVGTDLVPLGPFGSPLLALWKPCPPGYGMILCVLLGGLATAPVTTVIQRRLSHCNLCLMPKETSALWNSGCWEAAFIIVSEMGGGVLEQLDWGLNLITDRIVAFQLNMENAIDIICKNDVSAMIWEGKGWSMWDIYFSDITIICYVVWIK